MISSGSLFLYTSTGFIFQFGVVAPFLLWLVHLGYITLLLSFPIFGDMKLKKWSKIIHAISVPTAIILSLIAPIVILCTVGYVTFSFPPPVCFPASMEAVFYSVALVDCIILCCGVILMIVIIRVIHKVSGIIVLACNHIHPCVLFMHCKAFNITI